MLQKPGSLSLIPRPQFKKKHSQMLEVEHLYSQDSSGEMGEGERSSWKLTVQVQHSYLGSDIVLSQFLLSFADLVLERLSESEDFER